MKRAFLACAAILCAFSIYAKDIKELVVTTTPPMSCQNCENKIKKNLRFEKGVKNIETNLSEQRVTIEYDADKTNPEQLEEAFTKIGYHVDVITAQGEGSNEQAPCVQKESSCAGGCCQAGGKK